MKKIHALKFPVEDSKPEKKKVVDYLYIEADEDHISLQFNEKKGDLEISSNGRKNNCVISKLVYIHEGLKPVSILNADGGSWIQTGAGRIDGVTYVLDEFHLQKYVTKLTSHMLDSTDDARNEIYEALRSDKKEEFISIIERLKDNLKNPETGEKRINDSRDYILNTRPMGWSVLGASKMSELRAYYLNGGDMFELVRYQEKELPMAAGAENQILLSSEIIRSERNRHGQIGKYVESINHSVDSQIRKCMAFKALLSDVLL